jgi:hypothetical protein
VQQHRLLLRLAALQLEQPLPRLSQAQLPDQQAVHQQQARLHARL